MEGKVGYDLLSNIPATLFSNRDYEPLPSHDQAQQSDERKKLAEELSAVLSA